MKKILNNKTKIVSSMLVSLTLFSGVVFANNSTETIPKLEETEQMEEEIQTEPEVKEKVKFKAEDVYKSVKVAEESEDAKLTQLSNESIADLVMKGEFGEKEEIEKNLKKEGYDYEKIKSIIEKKTKENQVSFVKYPSDVELASNHETSYESEYTNKERLGFYPLEEDKEEEKTLNDYTTIKALPHKEFKSYMSWTKLSKSSPQGKLSAKASPDPETAIMMYNGRYLVALGSAYADEVGQEIDIVMESGQIIPAIVGDFKAAQHTNNNSTQKWDGSIVEFVVSSNEEAAKVTKKTGSYNIIFPGLVKEFRK